jgi:addiction module RelE/StbE family toxin
VSFRLLWAPAARRDLREIREYIARDSTRYADATVDRIIAAVERLAELPRVGRTVPEFGNRDEIRELIVFNYRVVYRVGPSAVSIAAVIHGARDFVKTVADRHIDRSE